MSMPRQETGLAWLGSVPPGWRLVRLGSVFTERKMTASDAEFEPLSVTMAGVVPRLDSVALTKNGDTRKLVRAGDYVINSRSDRKGSGGIAPVDGSVSVISTVIQPRGIYPPYAHHLLRSTGFQEEFYRWGSGIVADLWSTRYQAMSKITLPLPPLPEQQAIADFLDRETAKIDALIEKQTTLIGRLHERRAGTLWRAVTKGIGRDPLVESGTTWIGARPAHWRVVPLRRYAKMRTGHTPSKSTPSYWENCSIPWFTLADVWQLRQGNKYLGGTANRINEEGLLNSAAELLPPGTVVLSRTASVGFSGIMPDWMATSQDFWNWVPGEALHSDFLLYVFRSMTQVFEALKYGSTHRTIYYGDAAALRIPLPPVSEQRAIAAYLDRETARIDALIAKVERFVEVARERRSALITAAVTGQLDIPVRKAA